MHIKEEHVKNMLPNEILTKIFTYIDNVEDIQKILLIPALKWVMQTFLVMRRDSTSPSYNIECFWCSNILLTKLPISSSLDDSWEWCEVIFKKCTCEIRLEKEALFWKQWRYDLDKIARCSFCWWKCKMQLPKICRCRFYVDRTGEEICKECEDPVDFGSHEDC